jgi:hypothetical protein
LTTKRLPLLLGIAVALLGLIVPATAAAKPKKPKKPEITVMSRNLYLGSSLTAALNAGTLAEAIDGSGTIVNDVDNSKFNERAVLLAKEIVANKPDLVGLQEVALWRDQTPSDYGWTESGGVGTPATHVRYDWLQLLLDQLEAQGQTYEVVVSQDEFDAELPADVDGSDATGEPIYGADLDGRLTMRDVILRRTGSKVKVSGPQMGQFKTIYQPNVGGVPLKVDRGWVSVEGKVPGKKAKKKKGKVIRKGTKASKFHFVNAHLEAFGDRAIKTAQARELFAPGGPLNTKKQLIFLGDINSGDALDNVGNPGGDGIPEDQGPFNALTGEFGLINLGARQTCCFPSLVGSEIGSYRLDHTVDHVFVKPKIKQLSATVTGADPTVLTPSGLVASDHGGLVSELQLKVPKKKSKK